MKNILLLVHDDAGQEARLQAGLDLARALGGHLVCLDVLAVSVDVGIPGPETAAVLIEQEERRDATHRTAIKARLTLEDVPWDMRTGTGSFAGCIARDGILADLVLLNPRLSGSGPDMKAIAGAVLRHTGKPVLLVPEDHQGLDVTGPALVAWDGSPPAMAALAAAVPLLALASSVRILEIQGSSRGWVGEAASYLSRHGIAAEVDLLACFKDAPHETSAVIQERCGQIGAAYCVMGAYGHSPVREALLGGVTRTMLETAKLPVFLAH